MDQNYQIPFKTDILRVKNSKSCNRVQWFRCRPLFIMFCAVRSQMVVINDVTQMIVINEVITNSISGATTFGNN